MVIYSTSFFSTIKRHDKHLKKTLYNSFVTDGRTDGRTEGPTEKWLIELRSINNFKGWRE